MMTPNGRFQTNTRLCLSISDFHPDTWNPAWSVATILTGLLSFMVSAAGKSVCVCMAHKCVLPSPLSLCLCLSLSPSLPPSSLPPPSLSQVETTVTLGSIETPVDIKRQLAVASWTHNLRDRQFSQLFPHICEVRPEICFLTQIVVCLVE